MNTFKSLLLCCILMVGIRAKAQLPSYLDESRNIEDRVEDALVRMTLDEKIGIIHAQSKFSSRGIPRLGFPDFWTDDGPHGVRPDVLWDEWNQAGKTNDSCVAFPALTCLAASWNPDIAYLYGVNLGEEARYRDKDMILGPGVNIYRSPLNGRNFEYLGEDPFLASLLAAPYIQGLQSTGTAACIKHFCVNNSEQDRSKTNVIVSERALHEIYLPAFKYAVKNGKVWGVMGSYNLYKNQHNCENSYLLNDILKKDWNYDGVVISDWGGTHDTRAAAENGLDIEFGTGTNGLTTNVSNAYDYYHLALPYKKMILSGELPIEQLNDKVRRILRLFFRTTMSKHRAIGFLCSDDHYETARKIGYEGVVLLKNQHHILPIAKSRKAHLLIVGENAIKMMTVGGGSSSLKAQHETTPLQGFKDYIADHHLPITLDYARGYVGDTIGILDGVRTNQNLSDNRSASELMLEAVKKARMADYVIFIGGLNKSPHQDCEAVDREEYGLPYNQDKLVEAIAKANRNLIFINIAGNAVAMPWINAVPAVLQGWYLGSETGRVLANVIFGDVNPSGKLPFTWPVKLTDVPAIRLGAWEGIWREGHDIKDVAYKEGIYVGYRGVDRWKIKPLFPFGYGLSYTSFEFSDLSADKKSMTRSGKITFSVKVRNIGTMAGAEVVQLYIHDEKASVDRPFKELKGFKKVFLNPGETKIVSMTIDNPSLSFYDEQQHVWKSEDGLFTAYVGNSSGNLPCKVAFWLNNPL